MELLDEYEDDFQTISSIINNPSLKPVKKLQEIASIVEEGDEEEDEDDYEEDED